MRKAIFLILLITLTAWLVFLLPALVARYNGSILIPVSFFAAFVAGVLSILSPCSAALLPAFFAYAFKEKKKLVEATTVFFLGLVTIFVPLGFSASLISVFFITNQKLLFTIAGVIFIAWGLWALAKREGTSHHVVHQGRSMGSVYLMGVLFAFSTGTCAAPVIGAIFTLASTAGKSLIALALLGVFALGLTSPLFLCAYFFESVKFSEWGIVRGKLFEYRLLGQQRYLHSTNLILSLLFIGLGILFIVSKGTNALLSFFSKKGLTSVYYNVNSWLLGLPEQVGNVIFVIFIVGVILYITHRRARARENV